MTELVGNFDEVLEGYYLGLNFKGALTVEDTEVTVTDNKGSWCTGKPVAVNSQRDHTQVMLKLDPSTWRGPHPLPEPKPWRTSDGRVGTNPYERIDQPESDVAPEGSSEDQGDTGTDPSPAPRDPVTPATPSTSITSITVERDAGTWIQSEPAKFYNQEDDTAA